MWIEDIFSAIINTNKTKHTYFIASDTNSAVHFTWSPCIMCVQYRGTVQYRGGYHEYCGRISWVLWGVQYRGGYHDKCGDFLSIVGGVQYCGHIMSIVGLSWVPWGCSIPWGISWCTWGIWWIQWGCILPWEEKSFVIWVPHSTEHPQVHVQNFGGGKPSPLSSSHPPPPPNIFGNFRYELSHPLPVFQKY